MSHAAALGAPEQERRLRRMKQLATGLLLAMAVVFFLARLAEEQFAWLGFLRAFAEAAMIGALADWFAVTALFRHPLGVPIPHTAIIPRQKDAFGASLARFIKDNFLVAEALRPRLERIDFGARAGEWLRQAANAGQITRDAGAFTSWFLGTLDSTTLRHFLRENMNLTLREVQVTPFIARILDLLTAGQHHQALVDLLVVEGRAQLQENKSRLRARIETESPWWLPKFVDREIYDKIVTEIEHLLDRVGADSEHEARRKFNQGVERFIAALKSDPEVIARGEAIKEEILAQPLVQQYFFDMWSAVSDYLARESQEPGSRVRQRLENGVVRFGDALLADPVMRAEINRWLSDAVVYLVSHYRDQVSEVITDTVRGWDEEATSRRIELQVGSDLQFIRINGTVVGGLVGIAIYTMSLWLF